MFEWHVQGIKKKVWHSSVYFEAGLEALCCEILLFYSLGTFFVNETCPHMDILGASMMLMMKCQERSGDINQTETTSYYNYKFVMLSFWILREKIRKIWKHSCIRKRTWNNMAIQARAEEYNLLLQCRFWKIDRCVSDSWIIGCNVTAFSPTWQGSKVGPSGWSGKKIDLFRSLSRNCLFSVISASHIVVLLKW